MAHRYVIGVDFGSDSVRALVLDAKTGETAGEAFRGYPRWLAGKYQDASKRLFRQHPLDYLEGFTQSVKEALAAAGAAVRADIAAIAVDTTGSTPCPVDKNGTPLALLPAFAEEPDAMFHLWKDHTAIAEAQEINRVFSGESITDYTRYQGAYCSEWWWAKILHTTRANPRIRAAAYAWVEHSDWLPSLLAGETRPEKTYRCACAAGHKALWHSAWNGLPDRTCLAGLDEALGRIYDTYGDGPRPAACVVGTITPQWAEQLGINADAIVAGGSFDAHAGAVGAGIRRKTMVLNIGTSAVNMLVEQPERLAGKDLTDTCGQAENSIIPGLVGIETSQASFGDVYAWFRRLLLWPLENLSFAGISGETLETVRQQAEQQMLKELEAKASKLPLTDVAVALDWFNGRRYPNTNELVKSAISGIGLGTTAQRLYQALVLATAFGQRRIVENLTARGVEISQIIAVGGIAQKSSYAMQTLCDVIGYPTAVSKSVQACARGAAIFAAVAAGIYADVEQAQQMLCEESVREYRPDGSRKAAYDALYQKYRKLGELEEVLDELPCPSDTILA